jgi:hypothetical protein
MRHPTRTFHGRSGDPAPGTRSRRRRVALGVVTAKVAIVALILVLPSGLAIGLGAAHGVALLVAGVAAVSLLVVQRHRNSRSARTKTSQHEEGHQ